MSRIVIIGGMGPQASLELHRRIITGATTKGACDNEDYPEIVHVSIPVPDFISSGENTAGLKRIREALAGISFREDDKAVLACNTAHLLLPEIEEMIGIKMQSLIVNTVRAVEKSKLSCVGLLASPTTIRERLYERPLNSSGIRVIKPTPDEMLQLETAIRHVIANKEPSNVLPLVEALVERMSREGAEKVILGCTELSLIYGDGSEVIDPIEEVLDRMK